MCYSVKSSLKTTLISLFAIIYLVTSRIPHFQWIGITLIGWCGMQFAELLLWATEPQNGCTDMNKIITMTLVPLALVLQALGSLFGSLYAIPWAKSTDFRKNFIVLYSLFIILLVGVAHYYNPYKICTTVTKGGHLLWSTGNNTLPDNLTSKLMYFAWGLLLCLPLFLFWNKDITLIACLILIPGFGFSHGLLNTDSRASIWCYYTSYTSIIASGFLFLKQMGVVDIL